MISEHKCDLKVIAFMVLFFSSVTDMPAHSIEDGTVIRQLTPKDGELYSWLHHGTLFFRSYDDKEKGNYLYCGASGYLKTVSNLDEFSGMIQEQFDNDNAATIFLKSLLPRVIFSFMGPSHAFVIDDDYLESRKALPDDAWEGVPVGEVQKSSQILKKYDYTGPLIKDGAWTLEFYASLHNGSVEKWNLDGKIHPFSVDHLKKTVVEKEGTVIPMPEIGGP
jgi:hypothetical protein